MKKDKVLCLMTIRSIESIDINDDNLSKREELLLPLIDHLHNDKENGQFEPHYHVDTRYHNNYPRKLIRFFPHEIKPGEYLVYRYLYKISPYHDSLTITPVELIKNSKLKHKCIYKGKCPHRGYDLSNELPDRNGIITCPLHGLKFDTKNNNKLCS